MAAVRNGLGVVGVIPGGADIFSVKVFNGTCDPGYGCGPVYGTNMVQALQACEDNLSARQYADTTRPYRMVVSMSLGGPGPVTLEKLYFQVAAERNDILWVAASGNGAPEPGLPNVGLSYPAGYAEVVSVGAVDCNETLATFSQSNADVEMAAPGVKTVSDAIAAEQLLQQLTCHGADARSSSSSKVGVCVAGSCSEGNRSSRSSSGSSGNVGGSGSKCINGGSGGNNGGCGGSGGGGISSTLLMEVASVTITPPSAPALLLSSAQPLTGFTPSATYAAVSGRVVDCGLALSKCSGAKGAVCLIQRGLTNYPDKLATCTAGGGVGALIYDNGDFPTCSLPPWSPDTTQGFIPSATLSQDQGAAILGLLTSDTVVNAAFNITFGSGDTLTVALSGTSMATPHVAAAAARVWSAYPACSAVDLRNALHAGARDLVIGGTMRNPDTGFGLLQVPPTLAALGKAACAKVAKG